MLDIDKKLIAIFGPTTTNKTGFAINLARFVHGRFNIEAELVSADPRKIYKEMDIGQSKIPREIREKIPTHMIDTLPLNEKFNLYKYKTQAEKAIDSAHIKGHLPIIFGGTGVYLLSVVENWNIPPGSEDVSDLRKYGKSDPKYKTLMLSPKFDRQWIYSLVAKNVERMFERGLFEEFLSLAEKYQIDPTKPPKKYNALYETLAYREFIEYAADKGVKRFKQFTKVDLEKIKYRIKKDIKNYARRQTAWYDKIKEEVHLVENFGEARKLTEKFLLDKL